MPNFQPIFTRHHPQPGYCLVLRPFNKSADRTWGAIQEKLKRTFRWTDIKDLSAAGTIMEQILVEIARTDVVIVDITGSNPNVFFELGIARMAKPERKVLIVRREKDEDDRPAALKKLSENVVPFDIQSERYLSFTTTNQGIRAMIPVIKKCLWGALENSQWFLIAKEEVYSIGPLEGKGSLSAWTVEVLPTEFLERQFGPKAGRVQVTITIKQTPADDETEPDAAAPESLKASLGCGQTIALGSLPWRLKFHWFEKDKARFCVEPTGKRKLIDPAGEL